MVQLGELLDYCGDLLEVERFADYCPNGLQVEGRAQIRKIVTGVTASQALLEQAAAQEADAILVHHGYFWKGEDPRVIGMKYRRLRCLLEHQMSLIAYHLPLDAHPVYGNNAQLALQLGLSVEGRFGRDTPAIGMYGRLAEPTPIGDFLQRIATRLGQTPLHIGGDGETIQSVAWCTGAAQGYIEQAVGLGVDVYLTGEVSEQTVHIARENGIHFISAGHHATERYGIQALGEHLSQHFGIAQHFIEIPNPV
ncbi:MAG: Nif3-like dinuclear metal center hexameric protein [Gammaproteobacteria bacterium]